MHYYVFLRAVCVLNMRDATQAWIQEILSTVTPVWGQSLFLICYYKQECHKQERIQSLLKQHHKQSYMYMLCGRNKGRGMNWIKTYSSLRRTWRTSLTAPTWHTTHLDSLLKTKISSTDRMCYRGCLKIHQISHLFIYLLRGGSDYLYLNK